MTDELAADLVRKMVDKIVTEAECMMCGKPQPSLGWFWIGCGEEDVEFLCSEECYEQHTSDSCESAH